MSALLAIRDSRAPPSPAGLCVPESKMAVSRRRGSRAGARSFLCALLLSFSQFVGSDGTGGDAAAPGAAGTQAELPHRRFEYKYSFKGPHLVQSDRTVPFWAHAGSKPGLGRGGGFPPCLLCPRSISPMPCSAEGQLQPCMPHALGQETLGQDSPGSPNSRSPWPAASPRVLESSHAACPPTSSLPFFNLISTFCRIQTCFVTFCSCLH